MIESDNIKAVKKLGRYFRYRFERIENLSENDLNFVHRILSALLVKDMAIRESVDPKLFIPAVQRVEKKLKIKGFEIVS